MNEPKSICTTGDLVELAQRLHTLYVDLPPGQQKALQHLLRRASQSMPGDEVQGYVSPGGDALLPETTNWTLLYAIVTSGPFSDADDLIVRLSDLAARTPLSEKSVAALTDAIGQTASEDTMVVSTVPLLR